MALLNRAYAARARARGLSRAWSSATRVVGAGDAHSSVIDHRPFYFRRGHVGPCVEELQERIAALVRQRQQLRMSGASRALLERNRLRLARSQWELSHALIEKHLPVRVEQSH
jgi:hypothetical protein